MKNSSCRYFVFILIASLLATAGSFAQKPSSGPMGEILSMSDVHFDPFSDATLVNTLITSGYASWEGIFKTSKKGPSKAGSDANYPLLVSALKAMKQYMPNPRFIIITGDFLSHNFQCNYSSYGGQYPDSARSFTAKTIQFVASMIKQYFPTAIVLPVLGNNDSDCPSHCGDYRLAPHSEFLAMFARAWVSLQQNGNPAVDSSFVEQFSRGGYYTYPFPNGGNNARLVMLNTVFFSAGYLNSCGNSSDTPAADELAWLDSVMNAGRLANQPVWMASHIPPGIDVFSTLKGTDSCKANIKLMWLQQWNDQFLGTVVKNAPQIKAAFAGHTHMDEFRVVYDTGAPVSFIHITPSISPYFGNNPAFQVISYDTTSLELQNVETYFLNQTQKKNTWDTEYNFQTTYNISSINAVTLDSLRQEMLTIPAYRNSYMLYYKTSAPGGITSATWPAYWCGTGALTQQDFYNCYCK
jgi:hypothetical protein